ncbi:serine hydrolase domain-containing protein [Undibacterium sp. TJN25]|uniref:serine hydrolase domain-containing protein n=1 Tax=Undibacterium sp. TJN25 TaxID=3413056 RepID=UPI003BF2D5DA
MTMNFALSSMNKRRLGIAIILAAHWAIAPAASIAPTALVATAATDQALSTTLAQWNRDEHPDLKAVIVLRHGNVIGEQYYNGELPTTLHDIRSAGKSITSLLIGAALDQGKIRSVSDSVQQYWPETRGTAIGDVRLQDVLTMRSGLAAFDEDPDSPGNEDKMDEAADPFAFAFAVPRADPPGTRYRYNSLTAYIAGIIVEKAAHQTMADFAGSALFAPLGITEWQWAGDAKGHTKGQGNLSLTARDLAKIGHMVLDKGRYQGRQVLSASWIEESLKPRFPISATDPYADSYGYFWYYKVQDVKGVKVPVSFASGNGGNKIYVVPSLDLVVAITSSAYGKGYGQRRSEAILKAILPLYAEP